MNTEGHGCRPDGMYMKPEAPLPVCGRRPDVGEPKNTTISLGRCLEASGSKGRLNLPPCHPMSVSRRVRKRPNKGKTQKLRLPSLAPLPSAAGAESEARQCSDAEAQISWTCAGRSEELSTSPSSFPPSPSSWSKINKPSMPSDPLARSVYCRATFGRVGEAPSDIIPRISPKRRSQGMRKKPATNSTASVLSLHGPDSVTVTIGELQLKLSRKGCSAVKANVLPKAAMLDGLPVDTTPRCTKVERVDLDVDFSYGLQLPSEASSSDGSPARKSTALKKQDTLETPTNGQEIRRGSSKRNAKFSLLAFDIGEQKRSSMMEQLSEEGGRSSLDSIQERRPTLIRPNFNRSLTEQCMAEAARRSEVFNKLKDDNEIHRDDLATALGLVGVPNARKELIDEVFQSISTYTRIREKEFHTFVDAYIDRQLASYKDSFQEFDEDGSGFVDLNELEKLLIKLGVEPMRHVMIELIKEVDANGDGKINLQEFEHIMECLHSRQYFSKQEYDGFIYIFQKFDRDNSGEAGLSELTQMISWLGFVCNSWQIQEIFKQVDVDGTGYVNQQEFLLCMRFLRDNEINNVKKALFKGDGTQSIDSTKLGSFMAVLGYTPEPLATREALLAAGLSMDTDKFDLSDLWQLLTVYRERDGLTEADVSEIEIAFSQSDKKNTGEISNIAVGKILRNLGYSLPFGKQQVLVSRVDLDGSGYIALPELRKMIRMLKEDEYRDQCIAFKEFASDEPGMKNMIRTRDFYSALRLIEVPGGTIRDRPEIVAEHVVMSPSGEPHISFERFIIIAGSAVKIARMFFAERGAFTEEEIEMLQIEFERYDADGSGEIQNSELIHVIDDLFPAMARDANMRPTLKAVLAEVDLDGNGGLDFKEFIRLMRQVRDLSDHERADKERLAAVDVGFTQQEVVEFRDLFMHHAYEDLITFDHVMAIIGSICPLGDRNTKELRNILAAISEREAQKSYHKGDVVDFPDFLRLLKRLLDTNFAQIRERTHLAK